MGRIILESYKVGQTTQTVKKLTWSLWRLVKVSKLLGQRDQRNQPSPWNWPRTPQRWIRWWRWNRICWRRRISKQRALTRRAWSTFRKRRRPGKEIQHRLQKKAKVAWPMMCALGVHARGRAYGRRERPHACHKPIFTPKFSLKTHRDNGGHTRDVIF